MKILTNDQLKQINKWVLGKQTRTADIKLNNSSDQLDGSKIWLYDFDLMVGDFVYLNDDTFEIPDLDQVKKDADLVELEAIKKRLGQ